MENGVHYFEDGHFWMEVPGLPESEEEDDVDYPIPVKKNTKVTFSTGPIKVSETCVYIACSKFLLPLACN